MTPLNIAHRGGAALWPENTLFAFRRAADMGYAGAELDVQLTRDGQLAVFHDFRLNASLCRGPDGAWLRRALPSLRDVDFADLSAIDVGRPRPRSLYARRHRKLMPKDGEHIPTLEQVITCVRAVKDFTLFIEIKSPDDALQRETERTAEAVVAVLKRARFLERCVLVGFDWRALIHAKRLEPKLPCWFSTRRRRITKGMSAASAGGFDPWAFGGSIPQAIHAAGGQGWFASRTQATARTIGVARDLGLKVGVWTVNDARTMRAFARAGVDALCTDRPDILARLYSPSNRAVER